MKIIIPLNVSSFEDLKKTLQNLDPHIDIIEIWIDRLINEFIKNPGKALEARKILKEIQKEKNIQKIIFGLPVGPNNQENKVCQEIRNLAAKVKRKLKIDTEFQNEKFSTQEGLKLKTKKEKRVDHLAAAKILEYYLEKN